MILRPACETDAAAVAGLINQIVRETTITFTSTEKTQSEIAEQIRDADGAYFVAERAGDVTGYATYGPFRAGPGYAHTMEHSIAVAPICHKTGTGRHLMQALEAHAAAQGVHALIGGVSAENEAGLAFHDRLGFSQVGRLPQVGRKFDRWIDLVLMQKFL